jgi:phosphate transport system substrate-binding protein
MRNPTQVSVVVLVTLLLLMGAHFQASAGQSEKVITVKGSESMAPVVESLAKEYAKTHPDCIIKVSGGGDIGWKAFLSKESDVAMASRRILEDEKKAAVSAGLDTQEKIIGWGAIAIIVHPSNSLNELTTEQVRNIFVGRAANWSEVGGTKGAVSVLTVPQGELGTADYFERNFLEWPISPTAVAKDSFASVIDAVAGSPDFVGYVRLRNLEQLKQQGADPKIKVLSIKRDEKSSAVSPSRETVAKGEYPLMRPYYLYVDGNAPKGELKAFLEFCAAN